MPRTSESSSGASSDREVRAGFEACFPARGALLAFPRMSGHRDIVKRILPDRLVDWYRRRRVRILEAAGGATKITPKTLARVGWGKTAPARSTVRRGVVKVTPRPIVLYRRRKRAERRYMKALSYELLERETQLDYIEGRVAARRDGFYERIVREVLERTEMILQELDRRIEGVSARGNERMNAIEEQLIALRDELSHLRRAQDPDLDEIGARARAELPEVPSADRSDAASVEDPSMAVEGAGLATGGDDADVPAAPEPDDAGDEPAAAARANGSGNGHVPAQAPAATAAE